MYVFPSQMCQLLSTRNNLMKERKILCQEVEFLRKQWMPKTTSAPVTPVDTASHASAEDDEEKERGAWHPCFPVLIALVKLESANLKRYLTAFGFQPSQQRIDYCIFIKSQTWFLFFYSANYLSFLNLSVPLFRMEWNENAIQVHKFKKM